LFNSIGLRRSVGRPTVCQDAFTPSGATPIAAAFSTRVYHLPSFVAAGPVLNVLVFETATFHMATIVAKEAFELSVFVFPIFSPSLGRSTIIAGAVVAGVPIVAIFQKCRRTGRESTNRRNVCGESSSGCGDEEQGEP